MHKIHVAPEIASNHQDTKTSQHHTDLLLCLQQGQGEYGLPGGEVSYVSCSAVAVTSGLLVSLACTCAVVTNIEHGNFGARTFPRNS